MCTHYTHTFTGEIGIELDVTNGRRGSHIYLYRHSSYLVLNRSKQGYQKHNDCYTAVNTYTVGDNILKLSDSSLQVHTVSDNILKLVDSSLQVGDNILKLGYTILKEV